MDLSRMLRYLLVFSFGCTSYLWTATFKESREYESVSEEQVILATREIRKGVEVVGKEHNAEDELRRLIDPCDKIHIAMIATSPVQVRDASACLKSILNFRSRPLVFHIVVDDLSHHIFSTLFDTWQLPMVDVQYYKGYNSSSNMDYIDVIRQVRKTLLTLPTIMPSNIHKVIVLDVKMRVLQDILNLWREFQKFSQNQFVGLTFTNDQKREPMTSLILLHLSNIRQKNAFLSQEIIKENSLQIDCGWNKRITSEVVFMTCPNTTKAVYYVTNQYLRSGYLEPVKELLSHVLSTNGEVYRSIFLGCLDNKSLVTDVPNSILQDKCGEFYYSTRLKRRTHLFYLGSPLQSSNPFEITLMTMFTIDRFGALELLLMYWHGPVTAVAYVTDEELLTLVTKLRRSDIVQNSKDVVFHIVYKRHRLYPINYLRNVALKNTHTPYAIYIDVDLIPVKNLYDYLKQYIAKNEHVKDCLVVPAFQAMHVLAKYPSSRSALLKLLHKKAVIGYGQKSFAYGHSPTNFKKFTRSRIPYYVQYESRFEPYILMKTRDMPLYSEDVLDRMRDKVLFTRVLHGRGYKFKVLPETFVVHHPHPASDNQYYYKHERIFSECKVQMLQDHERRMRAIGTKTPTTPLLPVPRDNKSATKVSINSTRADNAPSGSNPWIRTHG